MTPIKQYIANTFINKSFHFICDCIIPIDVKGIVQDYEIIGNEIVLLVLVNGKIIHIGLNTGSLQIEEI